MEAEIITMTNSMFGTEGDFGIVTSGGTESLLMAVMAHRNYARKYKNVSKPNLYELYLYIICIYKY
jgi:sphinganine-1-phosphate aldolase